MKRYRFVPKTYGRGFVPVSREGWFFTVLLLAVVLGSAYAHGLFDGTGQDPTLKDAVGYLVDVYLIIFSSLRFMDSKTDGDLKWRRGAKRRK